MRKSIFLQLVVTLFLVCCSRHSDAQNIGFDWVKTMGGQGEDRAAQVFVDQQGNVYTTGYFNGTVDFDPGPGVFNLVSDSSLLVIPGFPFPLVTYVSRIFVSKLDASGNFVWAKGFGGPVGSDNLGKGITVDGSGHVYITGGHTGTITFDTITLTSANSYNVYVAKLDTSGNAIWAKSMGSDAGNDYGTYIDVDNNGHVYTTGFFADTASFGTETVISAGDWDAFVTKMDVSGNVVWAKSMGGPGMEAGNVLDVDSLGNVFIAGYFEQTADFDPTAGVTSLVSNGFTDGFICKLNASGNLVWVKQMGGVGTDMEFSIVLDDFGNFYTTGYFMGTVDFDPDPAQATNQTSNGMQDIFISKFDTAGNFKWVKAMGGYGKENGRSIDVDLKGNVYINGMFTKTVDFDPGANTFSLSTVDTGSNLEDMFFTKLDSAGNFVWAKSIGLSTDMSTETGLVVDHSGNVHTAFAFGSYAVPGFSVDFDPGPDTFSVASTIPAFGGSYDIFVLKLSCQPDSSNVTVSNCAPYTINGETFAQSGVYIVSLTSNQGCDSIVTLNLTIEVPEAIVTIEVDTLSTTQSYNAYQWFRNGVLIQGATNRRLTITANGDYQVAVTNEAGCTDTSDIYIVNNHGTSVDDVAGLGKYISVYPNPATHLIHINSPVALQAVLTGIDGRSILDIKKARTFSVKGLAEGTYFLRLTDEKGRLVKVEKIVKL